VVWRNYTPAAVQNWRSAPFWHGFHPVINAKAGRAARGHAQGAFGEGTVKLNTASVFGFQESRDHTGRSPGKPDHLG
jgi:hypothetical protein